MSHPDAFERILGSLNEAMLDDAHWPATSALIDEACGAKGNTLALGDAPSPGNVELLFVRTYYRGEDRSEWQREYFQHYLPVDEHLPRLRQSPDSKIVLASDLFSEEELKTSLTYNEAFPRYESQNGLNVRLDGPCGSHICWGISDSVDGNAWSSSQIDMVARILPHLRQYVRVRAALSEAGALAASATELLENTHAGIIQLDRRGRIVATNDIAHELLRKGDGLGVQDGRLCATSPADDAALSTILGRALPPYGGQGVTGSLGVKRTAVSPRLALHVLPVMDRHMDIRPSDVAALVLVVDPSSRGTIDPRQVETVFGFTPAESHVAAMLAQGYTIRDIAAVTGRSHGTIRWHINNMFSKHGISRQVELVQQVLSLLSLPRAND